MPYTRETGLGAAFSPADEKQQEASRMARFADDTNEDRPVSGLWKQEMWDRRWEK